MNPKSQIRTLALLGLLGLFAPTVLADGNLVPGARLGWPAVEAAPAIAGTNAFAAESAIARWSHISLRVYDKPVPIGVVAFHGSGHTGGNSGIAKVDFIANGGTVCSVDKPSINPATGYWEWWTHLNPSAEDGFVEVRAVVHPLTGKPRVLQGGDLGGDWTKTSLPSNAQSLLLYSNAGGKAARPVVWAAGSGSDETGLGTEARPYRTIAAAVRKGLKGALNHATIRLCEGTYNLGSVGTSISNTSGWLTIEACPGVERERVIIGGLPASDVAANLHTPFQMVHLRNVSIVTGPNETLARAASNQRLLHLWLEGVLMKPVSGMGWRGTMLQFNGIECVAITKSDKYRSRFESLGDGVGEWLIVAGADVVDCGGDVVSRTKLVRDLMVRGHRQLAGQHADVWQSYGAGSNRIFLDSDVEAFETEMIFLDNWHADNTDIAIVNNLFVSKGGDSASHLGKYGRHVLIWNNALINQAMIVYTDTLPYSVYGNVIQTVAVDQGSVSGVDTRWWTSNKLLKDPGWGSAARYGAPAITTLGELGGSGVRSLVGWTRAQAPRAEMSAYGPGTMESPAGAGRLGVRQGSAK